MQFDLRHELPALSPINDAYRLIPWRSELLYQHAEAKYRSFKNEMDANVFPCLAQKDGCVSLMREISSRNGFVPEATWLAVFNDPDSRTPICCGTVQGINDQPETGSIQNLGIVPDHRGKGLGKVLLHYALSGFQTVGLTYASLEVTAKNEGAIRLYRDFGFRNTRTVFKSIEIVPV